MVLQAPAEFPVTVLKKLFYKIAVDIISEFDRLSAASTERPLKHTAKKLKHFCSLKTE
jgi:hypothetical protein